MPRYDGQNVPPAKPPTRVKATPCTHPSTDKVTVVSDMGTRITSENPADPYDDDSRPVRMEIG
nr:hypothetical protein GCM10017745_80940 [Saccharothrix mutabilis subsp. capreolus]